MMTSVNTVALINPPTMGQIRIVEVMPDSDFTLARVLEDRRDELSQSSIVIVPLHGYLYEDEETAAALARLARSGRRVVAVLIDEDREATAEDRRLATYRMRRRGIEVHELGRSRFPRLEREEVA